MAAFGCMALMMPGYAFLHVYGKQYPLVMHTIARMTRLGSIDLPTAYGHVGQWYINCINNGAWDSIAVQMVDNMELWG
jgi:hypothetical protein